jgi:uncharacterized membrane protein (Fun14 family)
MCETKKGHPRSEEPKSMSEVIDQAFSASFVSKTVDAFAEPGTYYGFAAGACTGFALKKVAKAAALTFGAIFIGFQMAAKSEYVIVNWKKIEGDVKKYLPEKPNDESRMVEEAVNFLTTNTGIATAVFTSGFVTGLRMG